MRDEENHKTRGRTLESIKNPEDKNQEEKITIKLHKKNIHSRISTASSRRSTRERAFLKREKMKFDKESTLRKETFWDKRKPLERMNRVWCISRYLEDILKQEKQLKCQHRELNFVRFLIYDKNNEKNCRQKGKFKIAQQIRIRNKRNLKQLNTGHLIAKQRKT